jgi:hypothetical protein
VFRVRASRFRVRASSPYPEPLDALTRNRHPPRCPYSEPPAPNVPLGTVGRWFRWALAVAGKGSMLEACGLGFGLEEGGMQPPSLPPLNR